MTTIVPQTPVIDALAEVWSSLDRLLTPLEPSDWQKSTPCPGWNVQAIVSHIIGTEAMLAGTAAPETDLDLSARPHVRNDIGKFNETWVAELATRDGAEVLAQLQAMIPARLDTLRAMEPDAWNAEGFTPAGRDTHGRFMRIRVFDCWMHEQDIRHALGKPGHDSGPAVELSLDEITTAVGYIVGRKAAVPAGASITLDLTGPNQRTIHVAVAERAEVVPQLPGPATAVVRMPVLTFTRLAGGRTDPTTSIDDVQLSGDTTLAQTVLDNLAFTV
ncbi:MAG: maleylpyruvate isomerase family mycothiol-dependent enzyme [Acidimicrobiales bacterium]